MNEQVKKASFDFENYKVLKFSFSDPQDDQTNLAVQFEPSGEYHKKDGRFVLFFEFTASYNDGKNILVNAVIQASFKFADETPFEEIPPYFYRNSIAIVFPYVRSFATTLTAVGNVKPLILPVLNLSGLEQPLKDKTTVIQ